MASDAPLRRLTAIVAADVVNYSRLTASDEEGTLAALRAHRRELIDPKIAEYRGRIANTAGDSLLIEFPSVVEALRCTIDVQQGMSERNARVPDDRRIIFRVGINLGDVIEQNGDLLGDGVNIAARLEGIAEPGGICLSRAARDQVRDRVDVALEDIGEVTLKNIARAVRVFRVRQGPPPARRAIGGVWRSLRWRGQLAVVLVPLLLSGMALYGWLHPWTAGTATHRSSLSARTTIAVLPFANLSQDPDQDYFADGITNGLITDLSKFHDLFVIASNSTFAYKGKAPKIQTVGRELGVRYVLQGNVQKLGNRVRIGVELVDSATAQALWAERYDEVITNLFDLQDQITRRIVRTLAVKLTRLEQDRAVAKPTQNLQAYDYVLRGRYLLSIAKRARNFEARRLFQSAVDRDPGYSGAIVGLGRTYVQAVLYGWTEAPQAALKRAYDLAQKAIAADPDGPEGYSLLATVYLLRRQYDLALVESERAIALNPNDATLHARQGRILLWSGHPRGAILALETAMRYDPLMGARSLAQLGAAYYLAKRFDDAVKVLERAVGLNPDYAYGQVVLTAVYGQLGRKEDAARTVSAVRRLDPFFSTEHFGGLFRNSSHAAFLIDGLHKAGLH